MVFFHVKNAAAFATNSSNVNDLWKNGAKNAGPKKRKTLNAIVEGLLRGAGVASKMTPPAFSRLAASYSPGTLRSKYLRRWRA